MLVGLDWTESDVPGFQKNCGLNCCFVSTYQQRHHCTPIHIKYQISTANEKDSLRTFEKEKTSRKTFYPAETGMQTQKTFGLLPHINLFSSSSFGVKAGVGGYTVNSSLSGPAANFSLGNCFPPLNASNAAFHVLRM